MTLQLAAFGLIDWGVIALYMLVVLTIGALAGRRQGDSEDFFLARRSMPVWAVALSIVATTLSAATFIGAPFESFQGDLTYLILNVGQIFAAVIGALVFVPIFYHAGTTTIYGYLGKRFGPGAMIAGSVAFLVGRMLASGARLFMAGIAFSLMLFGADRTGDMILAIILFGAVGTAYTVFGGIRAVIWTDVAQITLVIGAAVVSVLLLLGKIPLDFGEIIAALGDDVSRIDGHSKLRIVDTAFDLSKPHTLWTGVFAATIFNLGWYATDHDLVQRVMSCRSPWRGSLSIMSSMLISLPLTMLFMFIGLLLFIYYGRPDLMGDAAPAYALTDAKHVYPLFLLRELPPGVSGLAMAGLCAVAMGSLDSAINAMAASAVSDLYLPWKKFRNGRETASRPLQTPRIAVALVGAVLTALAVLCVLIYDSKADTLIQFALGVMTFAWAGMVGVFLTAVFTKRGNTLSVVAALLAGAATVACLKWALPAVASRMGSAFTLAWPWWMVIATAVSFTICIIGRPRPIAPIVTPAGTQVESTVA